MVCKYTFHKTKTQRSYEKLTRMKFCQNIPRARRHFGDKQFTDSCMTYDQNTRGRQTFGQQTFGQVTFDT
jgi:hypothetical protein